eukprot:g33283.t2
MSLGVLVASQSPAPAAVLRRLQFFSVTLATPLLLLSCNLKEPGRCVQPLQLRPLHASLFFKHGFSRGELCGPATRRLLGAFAVGAVSTASAALLAALVLRHPLSAALGGWETASKAIAALTSKNIGSGINFVAVAQALQMTPGTEWKKPLIIAASLAVDSALGVIYFPVAASHPRQEGRLGRVSCEGKPFRRKGLAKELLRRSTEHVRQQMPQVKAVFLHVVTYNEAAIQLYESCGFLRIKYFPHFYYLHGTRDSTSQHLKGWLGSLLGQFSSPAASFLPYTAELGPRPREQGLTPKNSESRGRGATLEEQGRGPEHFSLTESLTTFLVALAIAFLAHQFSPAGYACITSSLLAVLLGTFPAAKRWPAGEALGWPLLYLYFAAAGFTVGAVPGSTLRRFSPLTLGTGTDPRPSAKGWPQDATGNFGIMLYAIHLLLILLLGRLAKLTRAELLVASSANIGGPATASSLASSKQWPQLQRPALLVGTFGNAEQSSERSKAHFGVLDTVNALLRTSPTSPWPLEDLVQFIPLGLEDSLGPRCRHSAVALAVTLYRLHGPPCGERILQRCERAAKQQLLRQRFREMMPMKVKPDLIWMISFFAMAPSLAKWPESWGDEESFMDGILEETGHVFQGSDLATAREKRRSTRKSVSFSNTDDIVEVERDEELILEHEALALGVDIEDDHEALLREPLGGKMWVPR